MVRIFCFSNNENPSRFAEVRCILVQKRSNSLANLLCHLVWSKIDFLRTEIRLISAILDGFSWLHILHITPNIGQNILVTEIVVWDCQLGRYMSVCRVLWQPPEMSVRHTKRLTNQFSMYIKFEYVIGLEILSGKLVLHMTYSLTWLKNAKLYRKRKNVLSFRSTTNYVFPCQIADFLTNLYFENSFLILISLAKNHKKLIF